MDYRPLRPDRDLTILIPARAGSQRVPHKNTRMLGGKQLIQWTLESSDAVKPAAIIVSTDDRDVAWLAEHWGCAVHHRKPEHATSTSPDRDWVLDVLPMVQTPMVAICRPTSPFRTASTIRRAYALLMAGGAHSVRAVQKVTEHPGKMWIETERGMAPLLERVHADGTPWHSSPTQSLPVVYVQNACLEIARVDAIRATGQIHGASVVPFFTDPIEGFDINTPADFAEAERMLTLLPVSGMP